MLIAPLTVSFLARFRADPNPHPRLTRPARQATDRDRPPLRW
jgi:hypothetical protein